MRLKGWLMCWTVRATNIRTDISPLSDRAKWLRCFFQSSRMRSASRGFPVQGEPDEQAPIGQKWRRWFERTWRELTLVRQCESLHAATFESPLQAGPDSPEPDSICRFGPWRYWSPSDAPRIPQRPFGSFFAHRRNRARYRRSIAMVKRAEQLRSDREMRNENWHGIRFRDQARGHAAKFSNSALCELLKEIVAHLNESAGYGSIFALRFLLLD